MEHINTRTQLIEFICRHVSSSIKRACYTGTVQVLGGFSRIPVPPGTRPGWIVLITSVHGREWFIGVSPHDTLPAFTVRRLCLTEGVPWQYWMGGSPEERRQDRENGCTYVLHDGDNPDQAWMARETARNDTDLL